MARAREPDSRPAKHQRRDGGRYFIRLTLSAERDEAALDQLKPSGEFVKPVRPHQGRRLAAVSRSTREPACLELA